MGGVVTDTNCQRASQSLYETIAVSLFARLPPRALLAASPLARDSCSTTFSLRIFEQKRDSDSCSTTFSLRIFEQKRDCSQSKGVRSMISIPGSLFFVMSSAPANAGDARCASQDPSIHGIVVPYNLDSSPH